MLHKGGLLYGSSYSSKIYRKSLDFLCYLRSSICTWMSLSTPVMQSIHEVRVISKRIRKFQPLRKYSVLITSGAIAAASTDENTAPINSIYKNSVLITALYTFSQEKGTQSSGPLSHSLSPPASPSLPLTFYS